MGNYISCVLSGPVGKSSSWGTKVIFPSGEIRRLDEQTKAAELMLEAPSHFLINTRSLRIGRRFAPLTADEDLEMNEVYVFFPMKRLNSVVMAADMGAMFLAGNSASKRVSRISPEDVNIVQRAVEQSAPVKVNFDEIEGLATPEFKRRLSMSRSRKPVLETIVEEPSR